MFFAVISAKIREPVISGVDKFAPVGVAYYSYPLLIRMPSTPYQCTMSSNSGLYPPLPTLPTHAYMQPVGQSQIGLPALPVVLLKSTSSAAPQVPEVPQRAGAAKPKEHLGQ